MANPNEDAVAEARAFRREMARKQAGLPPLNSGPTGADGQPITDETTAPVAQQYNYSDPGRFGARGYEYQVGDEFHSPGAEPDRALEPEKWAEWKKHASAWRNFIGGRQQYVNQMIGAGYNPEDLGITPRKEEGRAGYNRLMQPGVIEQLRANSAKWMRGSDAEIDPTTGLYIMGGGDRPASYYDQQGMQVNAQGRPVGGFYGQQNTVGQFGANAIPGRVANYSAPGRMQAIRPTPAPQPLPRAPESPRTSNYGGWGARMGQGSLTPGFRNRRPKPQYSNGPTQYSPFGI